MNAKIMEYDCKTDGHDWGKSGYCIKCGETHHTLVGLLKPNEDIDHDPVQKPNHYQQGEMETIEVIKGSMTRNQYMGYLKGNIIKYICRAEYKNGKEDLGKAAKYMQWLSEVI